VTNAACQAPIDLPALLAYWLGELDDAADARVGEHLLGCADCSAQAQWLADLAVGMRVLVHQGDIQLVVTAPFLKRAADNGLQLREYRVAPGGSVNCTLGPDDNLLITRLAAPLQGVRQVDLLWLGADGETLQQLTDVPFDPTAGEVLMASRTSEVRAMPETLFSMHLIGRDENGERRLGDYGFHHRPWKG